MPEQHHYRHEDQEPRHPVTGVPLEAIAPKLSPLQRAIEALKNDCVEHRAITTALAEIRLQLGRDPATTVPIIKELALTIEGVKPHSFLHDRRSEFLNLIIEQMPGGKQFALDTALNENAPIAARCAAVIAITPILTLEQREQILGLLSSELQPLRLVALLALDAVVRHATKDALAESLTDSSVMKVAEYAVNNFRVDLRRDIAVDPELEAAFPEVYAKFIKVLVTYNKNPSINLLVIDLLLEFPGGKPKAFIQEVASGRVTEPHLRSGLACMVLLHSQDREDHNLVVRSFREGVGDTRVALFDRVEPEFVTTNQQVQSELAAAAVEILRQSEFKNSFEAVTALLILNVAKPTGYLHQIADYFQRGAKDPELDGLFEAAAILKQDPSIGLVAAGKYIDAVAGDRSTFMESMAHWVSAVNNLFTPSKLHVARIQAEDSPEYRLLDRAVALVAAAPESESRNALLRKVLNGPFDLYQRWRAMAGLGENNDAAIEAFRSLTAKQVFQILERELRGRDLKSSYSIPGEDLFLRIHGHAISNGLADVVKGGEFLRRNRRYQPRLGDSEGMPELDSPALKYLCDIFCQRLQMHRDRSHDISALLSLLPSSNKGGDDYAINLVLLGALQGSFDCLSAGEKAKVNSAFEGVRAVLTAEQWQTYQEITGGRSNR